MEHAFVVAAYGHSPHLDACLASLKSQTRPSFVVACTSAPTPESLEVVQAHGAELVVHGPSQGIAHDWNMALAQVPAGCRWVTIAHQDDVYHPRFAERTLQALERHPDAVMAFTDYEELLEGRTRRATPLLLIKRALLELGFVGRSAVSSPRGKRNCLRFGTPIPCPSVTLRTDIGFKFDASFGVSIDWAAWLALSRMPGPFVWVREVLMAHRIHAASETSAAIAAGRRGAEDLRILRQLWPDWIARMIVRSYRLAYASNKA